MIEAEETEYTEPKAWKCAKHGELEAYYGISFMDDDTTFCGKCYQELLKGACEVLEGINREETESE